MPVRWALAGLTVAAFLTYAFEATAGHNTVLAIAVGLLYTVVAIVGYGWVDDHQGPRKRAYAIAFVVWQLAIGFATFGAEPRTGATLLLCVLVAQTVRLLGSCRPSCSCWSCRSCTSAWTWETGCGTGRQPDRRRVHRRRRRVLEREQRARAELAAAHERLREYAVQAEQLATTQERNRVARDIHDGLGHHLTVVQMQVQAARAVLDADPARADDVLAKAQHQAEEALAEVRRSVARAARAARPSAPLPEALRELAEETSAAGVPTELEVHGTVRAARRRGRGGAVPGRPGRADQRPQARGRATGPMRAGLSRAGRRCAWRCATTAPARAPDGIRLRAGRAARTRGDARRPGARRVGARRRARTLTRRGARMTGAGAARRRPGAVPRGARRRCSACAPRSRSSARPATAPRRCAAPPSWRPTWC